MKRYKFRLANVLRVRRIEEEKAALQLAAARRQVEVLAAAQAQAEDGYVGRTSARARATTATFLSQRALAEASAALVLSTRRRKAEAEAELDVSRAEWTDAAGRVTGLEKLDEKGKAAYDLDEQRAEISLVDDLVTSRHARKDDR